MESHPWGVQIAGLIVINRVCSSWSWCIAAGGRVRKGSEAERGRVEQRSKSPVIIDFPGSQCPIFVFFVLARSSVNRVC